MGLFLPVFFLLVFAVGGFMAMEKVANYLAKKPTYLPMMGIKRKK